MSLLVVTVRSKVPKFFPITSEPRGFDASRQPGGNAKRKSWSGLGRHRCDPRRLLSASGVRRQDSHLRDRLNSVAEGDTPQANTVPRPDSSLATQRRAIAERLRLVIDNQFNTIVPAVTTTVQW